MDSTDHQDITLFLIIHNLGTDICPFLLHIMFSPDPLLPASGNPSTRNPRRRQRTHSDENGLILPKAKKRRSALTRDTFVKPEDVEPTPNGLITMNGSADKDSKVPSTDPKELPVRTLRKASLRGSGKADGSLVLVCHGIDLMFYSTSITY